MWALRLCRSIDHKRAEPASASPLARSTTEKSAQSSPGSAILKGAPAEVGDKGSHGRASARDRVQTSS